MATKREAWEARQKALRQRRAHDWNNLPIRGFPWLVCYPGCGLVRLKNEPSERAARKPCPSWD